MPRTPFAPWLCRLGIHRDDVRLGRAVVQRWSARMLQPIEQGGPLSFFAIKPPTYGPRQDMATVSWMKYRTCRCCGRETGSLESVDLPSEFV